MKRAGRIEKVGTIRLPDGRQIAVRGREMGQWVEAVMHERDRYAFDRAELARCKASLSELRRCAWVRLGTALRLCPGQAILQVAAPDPLTNGATDVPAADPMQVRQ